MKRRFASLLAPALLMLPVAPAALACQCTLPNQEAIIAVINDIEQNINPPGFKGWELLITHDLDDEYDDDAHPNTCDGSREIPCDTNRAAWKYEATRTRGSMSKHQTAVGKLMDGLVAEQHRASIESATARQDYTAERSTRITNSGEGGCHRARTDEVVGRGLVEAGTASRSTLTVASDRNLEVSNPANEVRRRTDPETGKDRFWTPEMMLSSAGTLSDEQIESYVQYVNNILPVPPNNPKFLPAAQKRNPEALAYEEKFKRFDAKRLLIQKMLLREAALMAPSIELTSDTLTMWNNIVQNQSLPAALLETSGADESQFPDHYGALRPVTKNGVMLISERDHIRTEVFRRYANAALQSDPAYGFANMPTKEAAIKEMIAASALRNRMLYEIQITAGHINMLRAMFNYETLDSREQERLEALFIEASVR